MNDIISVPIVAVTMSMAEPPDIMGQFVIAFRLKVFGWMCAAAMAIAVAAMFWNLAN